MKKNYRTYNYAKENGHTELLKQIEAIRKLDEHFTEIKNLVVRLGNEDTAIRKLNTLGKRIYKVLVEDDEIIKKIKKNLKQFERNSHLLYDKIQSRKHDQAYLHFLEHIHKIKIFVDHLPDNFLDQLKYFFDTKGNKVTFKREKFTEFVYLLNQYGKILETTEEEAKKLFEIYKSLITEELIGEKKLKKATNKARKLIIGRIKLELDEDLYFHHTSSHLLPTILRKGLLSHEKYEGIFRTRSTGSSGGWDRT